MLLPSSEFKKIASNSLQQQSKAWRADAASSNGWTGIGETTANHVIRRGSKFKSKFLEKTGQQANDP